MDEEKYQKELFEDFEKPKRFFPRLSDFFPKPDFERNIALTLTLDRVVFIAIGVIMIMVVVYAFGVEAGKSRVVTEPVTQAAQVKPVTVQQLPAQAVVAVRNIPFNPATPTGKAAVPAPRIMPSGVARAQVVTVTASPYTIVIGAFANKDLAFRELDKIRKAGYQATMAKSDKYFQISFGSYAAKNSPEAIRDLNRLKRLYKDAYVKAK